MQILMIGNSYTYYHDMPKLLEALARENGKGAEVDSVTRGGRRLYENLAAEDEQCKEICALTAKNTYDVLILQEQSYFSLVDPQKFVYGVSELINAVSAKRNVLYATWGRKEGCALLEEYGWTRQSMTLGLDTAYRKAAQDLGAEVAPVGLCFARLSEGSPEIELYDPDLSHPSYTGSCVAAIVLYQRIFGELPKSYAPLRLDHQLLKAITAAAEQVA